MPTNRIPSKNGCVFCSPKVDGLKPTDEYRTKKELFCDWSDDNGLPRYDSEQPWKLLHHVNNRVVVSDSTYRVHCCR